MGKLNIKQYEVVLVNLDPTVGHEIKKTRPCVVISPNEMNTHLSTVIVAPMTTTIRKYPSRVQLKFEGKVGMVALDQIRTIDRKRIIKALGKISSPEIKKVKKVLMEMLVL